MTAFRSRPKELRFDPAFDDAFLAEARDEIARGRWEPALDLLEATKQDWELRAHRVRVLAGAAAESELGRRWQNLDTRNRDAAAVRAQAEVVQARRALHRRNRAVAADPDFGSVVAAAERQCRRAVELSPRDPTPWVSLLELARLQNADRDEFWRRWQELRRRDPWSREGHRQALTFLYAAWHGSHAEMYDFAYWLAGEAPEGSALVMLPLVAHAESFRAHSGAGGPGGFGTFGSFGGVAPEKHWTRPQTSVDLDAALDHWYGRITRLHATDYPDLNHLAHALIFADRREDAQPVLRSIGMHATRVPWIYTGDGEASVSSWQHRLLGDWAAS